MECLGRGYVHIYTGTGKGKTCAALGLALRAAGRGLKTVVVQFMKGQYYGELEAQRLTHGLVTVEQFGSPEFCRFGTEPDHEDVERARRALERVGELMRARACDILVADEIVTACLFRLLSEDEVLEIIRAKPDGMELVLTGRGATQRMIESAHLVTDMHEVKHYYTAGVQARQGIEN